MTLRIWACAVLVALLACATAQAAPVTVNLRVEGASSTIFEAPVTTDGKQIDKGGGPHQCDGTSASPPLPPGPTMTSALDDASIAAGFSWEAQWFDFGGSADFFITKIGADAADAANFWGTVLGYQPTSVGGCQQQVVNGDLVLFAFGGGTEPLLQLNGSNRAVVGQSTTVTVTDGRNSQPVAGATLSGLPGTSGPDGQVSVAFDSPGVKRLKASLPGTIRSNTLEVCVEQPGANTCAGFVPTLSVAPNSVQDSAAPVARISGPVNGRKYRRGPRLLKGSVGDDPSGIREVKIALRRHVRGRSCQWWSGRRERFVGTHCKKVFFFAIGSNRNWSYLLPRALPPGRYVLDVKAFDGRRNRDEKFVTGKNRSEFEVVSRKSRGTTSAARTSGRGARVQVMVVGKSGTVVEAVTLQARPAVVRASGRACKVNGSTPLAALVAALDKRRVGRHVRDFGACERRNARSSGQLFVDRIGGERNRGQDGWVYKVNDFARDVGAADPAGLRLRKGNRVLWLYCVMDAQTRSCQRSLRVTGAEVGPPGSTLRVLVEGYDDRRPRAPVAGATVTLGPVSAVTDASGHASLVRPAAGTYTLAATAPGAMPSFPVKVKVR
jgi:hypothetical protein